MQESIALISSPIGVLAVLCAVAAFFFLVAEVTDAKLFKYLPPLLFIYATPVFLNNFDVIPSDSPVYSGLSTYVLPAFIVLMLIKVNIPAVISVMGKGVLVMLMGTAGVIVGAVVAYLIVHPWLSDDAWKGYGALAGSWIGGTANMAATAEILGTSEEQFGLAIVADNMVYIVWLPLLLLSRDFADKFNRWARVPEDRIASMDKAAALHVEEDTAPRMSVNSIAEDLGLSKGRLYEVIRPMASGSECPNCQSDLVFHNRTARDKGDAECPECGSTADAEPIPPPRALDPTTDTRGIVAGLLVGAAAGLLIGRFLRG